jgi:YidC/Oxa1 family membrane protein insertase
MNSVIALITPVRQIVDVLKPILVFFHELGLGWGMTIVALTCLVRAAMLPLTVKQFKSMQAMSRVTPQIKALQEKYKDDKQRQQQELMKFYADNKINPFAACLPLVMQLPFFLGLFYLLRTDLRREICGQTARACGDVASATGAEKFLFIPDLTDKATGGVLITLMVLYIGSQLLSSILMTVTVDRNQKILMYALPFMFTAFIINFPAGLIVYWITTNLWTVAQQWTLRKRYGAMRPPADPDTKNEDAPAAPGGGLFARLSAAAAGGGGSAPAPSTPSAPSAPPPRSPRKKKKRSGRRR